MLSRWYCRFRNLLFFFNYLLFPPHLRLAADGVLQMCRLRISSSEHHDHRIDHVHRTGSPPHGSLPAFTEMNPRSQAKSSTLVFLIIKLFTQSFVVKKTVLFGGWGGMRWGGVEIKSRLSFVSLLLYVHIDHKDY